MRRLIITCMVLMLVSGHVLAHGGTDDIASHQQFIAGVGVVLILCAGIYSLLGERPDEEESEHDPLPPDNNIIN